MTASTADVAIPVNPVLPSKFDDTPNEQRPPSHQKWWFRPFIVTDSWDQIVARGAPIMEDPIEREKYRASWFDAWPSGTRYDVRCLDGGAWDRSTCWGMFRTMEEAQQCARGRDPQKFAKAGLLR